MKKCRVSNYNKELHANLINFSKLKSTNVDELIEDIYSVLEGLPFSTDIDDSINEDSYTDSIEELVKQVKVELGKIKLPFELSVPDKARITKALKSKMLPRPLTLAEQQIAAVIKGTDLVREEDILKIKYKNIIADVYGTSNPGMDAWRIRGFEDSLALASIIDTRGKGTIVDSDRKLNNNIMDYLESQYKVIRDFLSKYHLKNIAVGQFPEHLYIVSSKNKKVRIKTLNHYNTLTAMYNIIESLKNESTFLDSIENGWNEDIDKVKNINYNRELYRAVNSFINLTYFDDVLNYSLNKFININPLLNPILYTLDAFGTPTYSYKYLIAAGNSNARKTWGDEVSDSLEEMAKFNQVLISRIPLYDYKDEIEQWGRLAPKDFIGTVVKLKSIGTQVTDNEFRNAAVNLINEQSRKDGNLHIIFKKLFIDKNLNIIRELNNKGFDYNNMNVLYSIYRTVFDTRRNNRTTKSWLEVEENYLKETGLRSRYNLAEAMYGLICSNTSLDYLLTVYNRDTLKYETSVKDKYSIAKTKFDIINDINENSIKREDRPSLLSMYQLTPLADNKSYTINISGTDYQIKVNGVGTNILSKKNVSAARFQVSALENFKSIDLGAREKRNAVISRSNLNETELQFTNILSFIDNMLNTDFSKNIQSLNELVIAMKGSPNFFHDLFMSAARALVIQDIYNDFNLATKENGEHYAKTELRAYLRDNNKFPGVYDAKNLYDYFRSNYDGYQLTTVDSNEPWVIKLANTRALLANDTSKSVISNLEGNKLPNSSPAYLCGDIQSLLAESSKSGGSSAYLLFSENPKALLGTTINSDTKSKDGKVKLIKNMTEGELLLDAIINKFLIPIFQDGTIFSQCTTQSDKTKFISYHVNLEDIVIGNLKLRDLIKSTLLESIIASKMFSTIGRMYNKTYERVIEDYKKIFPSVKSVDDINALLKGAPALISTGQEFTITSEEDLMKAVNAYNKANPDNPVTFYKDLHYRQISGSYIDSTDLDDNGNPKKKTKKHLAFNELLEEFATNLYNPKDSSRFLQRVSLEKKRFLKTLLDKLFSIPVDDQIRGIMRQTFGLNPDLWIKKIDGEEYVILAKSGKNDILYGTVKDDEDIVLNPMLNAFFLIDNLIGNNLRFSTTGSEINHKIKALSKLDLKEELKNSNLNNRNILLLNPSYHTNTLTFHDLKEMILKGKDLLALGIKTEGVPLESTIADLESTYNKLIYAMENLGENALFKRNVIMSATMTKMVPSLEGICENMHIACIADVPANVFNFDGKTDVVDAHDGSAQLSPFWSILENKSLGPNEVGTVKKPIQHWFDDRYSVATLLKYATDTITNLWMRLSVGNDLNNTGHAINLYNVFKKMHNKRWHVTDAEGKSIEGAWKDGEINLIDGCAYRKHSDISFSRDIMQLDLYPDNLLYYNKAGNHIKIVDLGRENGIYYTIEEDYDSKGSSMGDLYKVYHYFDNTGKHIPSETILENTPYHTIDSLYELHSALGGIWSESFNGENFVYSEGSNVAVVNYINAVSSLKEGADPNDLSIKSYDLPLKRAMIHVIANNSAVKNGVGNINPNSSWYDNTELSYMTIGTGTYGILQDSDHTADEAHMTEFSLVISSLDAGGYLHDYVTLIYQQLGQTAIELSKVELDAVSEFRETSNISAMYDVVGRTIMANIRSGKGEIGLAEAIIKNIKSKFNLNTDHSLDKLKIPFSDPNIYSSILSTFVSNINKKSIKRLYPGLGTVMVPSYNISMIYDINGTTYQFEDIVKEAAEKGFTSSERDNNIAKLDIVKQYLESILQTIPFEDSPQSFIPTENVLVTVQHTDGSIHLAHVSLNEIHNYYKFQENPREYLQDLGYTDIASLKFLKDVTVPRNLAPVRITWDYVDAMGIKHHTNIFNHWRVKGLIQELAAIGKNKELSKIEKKLLSKECRLRWNVDKAFHELKAGKYEISLGAEPVAISNLKNKAAEIIMSNLYATKFGIKKGESLVDIMKKDKDYFQTPTVSIDSENYDLVFTKEDGKHTFITFKPLQKNDENCSSYYKEWENVNKKSYERQYELSEDSPIVVNKVYAVTLDNVRLFEIGREIVREDVIWDNKKLLFVKGGKKVDNLNTYRRDGDRILQYIEFVTKHRVNETSLDGSVISYDLYNINRSALKKCFEKALYSEAKLTYTNAEGHLSKLTPEQMLDLEVNKHISKLLGDIYKSSDYGSVLLNKSFSFGSGKILQETLYNFSKEIDYDQNLSDYVNKLYKLMKAANPNKNDNNRFKILGINLNKALRSFNRKNADKRYTSFLKSQSFTVARIPAQTLQSFMKMKNVGFTGTDTGQCFVTAWLTWLLGSKINNN